MAGTLRPSIRLIPERWVKGFRLHVGPTFDLRTSRLSVRARVEEKAEAEKRDGFGRTAILTDRSAWTDEGTAGTDHARGRTEEDYHVLKDGQRLPGMPTYHRKDRGIRERTCRSVRGLWPGR